MEITPEMLELIRQAEFFIGFLFGAIAAMVLVIICMLIAVNKG